MKLKKSEFICAAISAWLLMTWMPASAQDGPVSSQDIQASWVGKTMVGTVGSGPAAGKPVEFTMYADGSAAVSGAAVDTGTWHLSDQGYCATWKKIRGGQERCFTVIRKGAELQVINPDGSLNTTVTQIR
jgi:hypothetical protein